ncbi:MAG: hypothetical protein O3C10_09230 [Chloroflexi bacterium]|nr:hypothetical protein [Chloroflexota bacterium]
MPSAFTRCGGRAPGLQNHGGHEPSTWFEGVANPSSKRIQRLIDRLLDQAEAAIESRDWATVRESAQIALAIDPYNADAQAFVFMVAQMYGTDPGMAQ